MILVEVDGFYADLGRRVRSHRLKKHFTQQQLGSSLDPRTTRASIANIEAGKQRVLAHTLAQLAYVLEVSVSELLPPPSHARPEIVRQELMESLTLPDKRVLQRVVNKLTPTPKRRRR